MDQYAVLAGYPHVSAFKSATPAKWIRHVREQLRSTGGKYRRATSETKRDWHKLLDYNRHAPRAPPHRPKSGARARVLAVASKGYAMLPGEGIGEDPAWTPEESVQTLRVWMVDGRW